MNITSLTQSCILRESYEASNSHEEVDSCRWQVTEAGSEPVEWRSHSSDIAELFDFVDDADCTSSAYKEMQRMTKLRTKALKFEYLRKKIEEGKEKLEDQEEGGRGIRKIPLRIRVAKDEALARAESRALKEQIESCNQFLDADLCLSPSHLNQVLSRSILSSHTFALRTICRGQLRIANKYFIKKVPNFKNSIEFNWLVFKTKENYLSSPSRNLKAFLKEKLQTKKFYRPAKIKRSETIPFRQCVNQAKNEYKIHLMPKPKHFQETVDRLFAALETREDLAKSIKAFKITKDPRLFQEKRGKYAPLIVLYVTPDQHSRTSAQTALDALKTEFEEISHFGSGKKPRFNRQVTPLIYYAQGDSTCKYRAKKAGFFKKIFESNGVHFKGRMHRLNIS